MVLLPILVVVLFGDLLLPVSYLRTKHPKLFPDPETSRPLVVSIPCRVSPQQHIRVEADNQDPIKGVRF